MSILKPNLARDVTNLVYAPTTAAYFIIAVDYEWDGLAFYFLFVLTALWVGLFRQLRDWPVVSKIALLAGPLLLVAAFFFLRISVIGYWTIVPGLLYPVLGMGGTLALRKSRLED